MLPLVSESSKQIWESRRPPEESPCATLIIHAELSFEFWVNWPNTFGYLGKIEKRDQLIKCHLSFSCAGRIFCPFASFLPQNHWSGSGRGHRLLPFRRGGALPLPFCILSHQFGRVRTGAKPGNVGQNLLAMILNLANEKTPLTTQRLNSTFLIRIQKPNVKYQDKYECTLHAYSGPADWCKNHKDFLFYPILPSEKRL